MKHYLIANAENTCTMDTMDTSVHLYMILQMCSEISFKPYIYPFAKLKFTFVISAVRPVW